MRLFDQGDNEESEEYVPMDLMCGVAPRHIRRLCDSPFDGGRGYTPRQVGELTIDQIYSLLCDSENLRKDAKVRSVSMTPMQVLKADKNGTIPGVAGDGTPIKGTIVGKSLARRIREAAEAKKFKSEPPSPQTETPVGESAREARKRKRAERLALQKAVKDQE